MAARQMAPARRHTPDAVFSLTLDGTSCENSSPMAPRLAALRARPETRSTTPCQGGPSVGRGEVRGRWVEMEQGQRPRRNICNAQSSPTLHGSVSRAHSGRRTMNTSSASESRLTRGWSVAPSHTQRSSQTRANNERQMR